ncbi:Fibronectin type III domain-containing protein [Paenibacillus mucilaginosus 3016]|uniref:Fibronectin type III domain-containing protein n=2 Tax=Paenibacillus mucilaginosus TaxID=61624 RepID=H6NDM6_9BACL|nr:glycoside hydrolase [Paenibacillus mucilaginosus]AFC31366.1 Fibronectin type III domain-containing protein [Paenibacillus mucilaginosus 3016]AFH63701.1 fibronectin type III [Paenibacillus mucilaginosus K02]WFA19923.1 hypothetical protein ERY13_23135 [Paenibacillus mucilaginosus]
MKTCRKWTSALLTCSLSVGLVGHAVNANAAANEKGPVDAFLTLDASVKYQKIDNFGASDAWSMEPLGKHWTEENKNRVADLLFSRDKGIGLSAWRFNIGAGSTETDGAIITNPWRRAEAFKSSEAGGYDWSRQAGQQWFLKAAKERGVDTLIAFVNSPPVWMTKNGHAQPDATVGSTNLKEGYEDEFAAFLSDVLEHFEQNGLAFDYISPINEPTWDWNRAGQEGNRYNNDDIKRVILELHRQLKQRGIEAGISAPDGVEITALLDDEFYQRFANKERYTGGANSLGAGKYREYIKDLLGDPQLKEAVGNKIASHSYWSDYSRTGDDRLGLLRDLLAENLEKYGADAKYWMSEYCILGDYGPGRDLGIDPALHVARTIHFDLTRANAAAWQWWTAVSKEDYKDGLIYTDFTKEGDEQNILPSKILWTLGNYSKFIRPGADRIQLAGLDEEARSGLLGSAYKDEKEQTVTTVLVNDSTVDKRVKLSIQGLASKDAVYMLKPYITSADQDLAKGRNVPVQSDGTFETVIPARSVVTLYGDLVKAGKKPDAPEDVRIRPANKGLQIDFTLPKGAYEVEVTYGEKQGNRERTVKVTAEDVITLSNLRNGIEYYVTLRAGNKNGFGPPSKRAYGVPELLAPSGVSAEGTDGGFTVKYDAAVGVPSYRVRYGLQPGAYDRVLESGTASGLIRVEGLQNGTVLYGVVEAVDGTAVSPPSAAFQVTPDIPAPGKILAVAGDAKAHVEVTPVAGAAGYGYELLSGAQLAAAGQSGSSAWDLAELTNDMPVTVRVYSVGRGGNGTAFAETTVTPKAEELRFEDRFEAGGLSRYQQDVSEWKVEDGVLKHASGGDHQGEIGIRDLQIIDGTLTVIAKHATAGADWGITFRGPSYDKGYGFGFENGSLYLRKDGQALASSVPFTAKLGGLYLLEVRLQGKRIQALIDGEVAFDVTDTAYTSGRVGLHSWGDAEFGYVKAAREADPQLAKPEIYQVKAGDRQAALKYSEVDGADAYAIQYQAVTGGSSAPVEIPAKAGSTLVTGLTNDVAYSFWLVAKRGGEEVRSEPVTAVPAGNQGVLYYVDAGDGTPSQPEAGEQLGALQTLEEQAYGPDPVTGVHWGYEADDGLTWAHTSPVEAYPSIRQYDGNENGKGLAYRFELPNGTYGVKVGFFDPWAAGDRRMNLTLNGQTVLTDYVIGTKQEEKTFDVEVSGGELIVKVVKAGASKPMLSYIAVEQR